MSPDLSIDRAGPTVEYCAIRFGEFGVRQRSTHCTLALPACHQRDLLIERPIVSFCQGFDGVTRLGRYPNGRALHTQQPVWEQHLYSSHRRY